MAGGVVVTCREMNVERATRSVVVTAQDALISEGTSRSSSIGKRRARKFLMIALDVPTIQ